MPRRARSSGGGTSPAPTRRRHRYNLRETSSRKKRDARLGDTEGRISVIPDDEFREKNTALKVETVGDALKVDSVDLQATKNNLSHHTDDYELEALILRRGQEFDLTVTFDRNVSTCQDILALQFTCGPRPQESKGTLIRLSLKVDDVGSASVDVANEWSVKVTEVKAKSVSVTVNTAPDACIGKYELYVETKVKDKDSEENFTRHEEEAAIYMLFNPFCKDDVVYMEDVDQRNEYVMNDTGRIWMGSSWRNFGHPWNFGQFENPVLEVSLGLLDKAELAYSARGNVVSIVRAISALANSSDDEGVLEGRWSDPYKNCTKPWEWTGSVAILQQFHDTGKPVKYGQCWVFSGITTTLLRTLGIPTRSVTNFQSAHDTDCSMTIDMHLDEDGDPIEDLNDSTWNFHVWNESWFRRLDLPEGYDGWQAHDATPQETSEGVYRCGPASLRAIKEGHVYLNYDVGFIFSEVNGDKVQWQVHKDGSYEVMNINKFAVGKNISTKAVGKPDRHDLTWDYKYFDGSEEERRVVKFVNRFSTRRKENIYKLDKKQELDFDPIVAENLIGEDIEVGVIITNPHPEDRDVKVRLTLSSMYYTGVVSRRAAGETFELKIKANDKEKVIMTVPAEDYEKAMNPDGYFKLYITCKVKETNRMFATQETFCLRKPGLTIDLPDKLCCMADATATITFKNTTNLKLHNAVFNVEGSYMVKPQALNVRKKVINPDDEVSVEVAVYPRRLGIRSIMATFSSDELHDVDGEKETTVISKTVWEEEDEKEEEEEDEKPEEKMEEEEEEKMEEGGGGDATDAAAQD